MIVHTREINECRLSYMGLTTFGDNESETLIQALKIIKDSDSNELNNYFKLARNNLRGHSLKVFKSRYILNVRKFAFSNKVVDIYIYIYLYIYMEFVRASRNRFWYC